MSYASTGVNTIDFTDDYVSPTTDVWQDEYDQLLNCVQTTWQESVLNGWAVPILRDINAFEAVDAVESTILDRINPDELKEICVVLSSPENCDLPIRSIRRIFEVLPYFPLEGRYEPSYHQTWFSPDFFDIRRCARYVMGSTPVSVVELERVPQSERKVPITIHPEVIREAEEQTLTGDLEVGIELARESYPTLSEIELSVEDDPEILDRRTIRFTLSVSGDPETILHNEGLFKQRFRSSTTTRARELITVTYRWGK